MFRRQSARQPTSQDKRAKPPSTRLRIQAPADRRALPEAQAVRLSAPCWPARAPHTWTDVPAKPPCEAQPSSEPDNAGHRAQDVDGLKERVRRKFYKTAMTPMLGSVTIRAAAKTRSQQPSGSRHKKTQADPPSPHPDSCRTNRTKGDWQPQTTGMEGTEMLDGVPRVSAAICRTPLLNKPKSKRIYAKLRMAA